MKIRYGFVSNSSSSSFAITNKTKKDKTWKQFVKEFMVPLKGINKKFDNGKLPGKTKGIFTTTDLINCEYNNIVFPAGVEVTIESSDEDYDNPASAIRATMHRGMGFSYNLGNEDWHVAESSNDQMS